MLRFPGIRFGIDVDLRRRVVRVVRLEAIGDNPEEWTYAGVEMPYPVPPEFVKAAPANGPWHLWNLAWDELRRRNVPGYEMLRNFITTG